MGCVGSKTVQQPPGYEDPVILAADTIFTASEVEALYELFKKLSNSVYRDGLIHKEEFQLALFRSSKKENLFADRVFDLFDYKHTGVIDFGEFVRSLSIFHPRTSEDAKIQFAFKLYDLRQTGYIEREEVKQMVIAILNESEMDVSDDMVEIIVDKTFAEIDLNGDGKIDIDEWCCFAKQNPSTLKIMTLPYLKNIPNEFPSFVSKSEMDDEID